ncbi:MAG: phosphatase PAP2 family protein [Noviherbaspirillum sp.]
MIAWPEITHFGDVSITSLIAFAIAAWLFVEDEKRLALWWSTLFAAGLGAVVATKIAFIGWGIGIHALDFTGFSGHAMRSAAVMPVLFYLILQRTAPIYRAGAVILGLAFGAMVGVSRLAVHAHSVSEVVAGWFLGALVGMLFIWSAHTTLRKHVFKPLRIALSLLILLPAPYVYPAPTQEWLTEITLFLANHEQPFPRAWWKKIRPRCIAPPRSPSGLPRA